MNNNSLNSIQLPVRFRFCLGGGRARSGGQRLRRGMFLHGGVGNVNEGDTARGADSFQLSELLENDRSSM